MNFLLPQKSKMYYFCMKILLKYKTLKKQQIVRQLPTKSYYFQRIYNCSKYINAYPILGVAQCLSYSLCRFPLVRNLSCSISKTQFWSRPVRPRNFYIVHTRIHSEFILNKDGCFL